MFVLFGYFIVYLLFLVVVFYLVNDICLCNILSVS